MKVLFFIIITVAFVDLGLLGLVDWQWLTGLWLLVAFGFSFGSSHASEERVEEQGCVEVREEAEGWEHDVRSGLLRPSDQGSQRGPAQCSEAEE